VVGYLWIFLTMRNISDEEKIKTRISWPVTFCFSALYDSAKRNKMHCCVPTATLASRMRHNVSLYIACLVKLCLKILIPNKFKLLKRQSFECPRMLGLVVWKGKQIEVRENCDCFIFRVKQSTLLVLLTWSGGKSFIQKVDICLPWDTAWHHWKL
jgi:hypothetical protein